MLKRSLIIIATILLIDQALKFHIKLNYHLGEEKAILGNFFKFLFVENYGMAFGLEFGGEIGKVILTIFRFVAIVFLGYLIYNSRNKNLHPAFFYSMSFILAGALGNLIDSLFYGMIFSESTFYEVARLFPENGGYASFMHGKVVDMFYAPIINVVLPEWVPIWGGTRFEFFKPIFNVADSSITIGVILMLIFYNKIFPKKQTEENIPEPTDVKDAL